MPRLVGFVPDVVFYKPVHVAQCGVVVCAAQALYILRPYVAAAQFVAKHNYPYDIAGIAIAIHHQALAGGWIDYRCRARAGHGGLQDCGFDRYRHAVYQHLPFYFVALPIHGAAFGQDVVQLRKGIRSADV